MDVYLVVLVIFIGVELELRVVPGRWGLVKLESRQSTNGSATATSHTDN